MSKAIIGNTIVTPYPQTDWNQNDPTKADYVKNRPFYKEEKSVVLAEFNNFTENPDDPSGYAVMETISNPIGLVAYNVYIVKCVLDTGTVIETEIEANEDDNGIWLALDSSTQICDATDYCMCLTTKGIASVTVFEVKTIYHTIPQEYLDLNGTKAPSKTVSLNEVVPAGSMPSICNFEFKPTTPLCIYDLANKQVMPNQRFNGREIPFLTTTGNLIVTNKDNKVKMNKYIDSLININRNGWSVSDKLTQDGVHKVWSKKFYLTKTDYASYKEIDYGNAKNSICVFEFDESDFSETGIPAKLDNIPVATPCFYTGSDSQSWLNARVWGSQPFPMKFSYNQETGKYTMTIRGFGVGVILSYLQDYSKTYIYYQLETPCVENDFLAMGLEEGDTVTFENDYSYIQEYLDVSEFFDGHPSDNSIPNSDTTPTFSATIPQTPNDALIGFSNAAKIFNEGQTSDGEEIAQDYSWIGDGDGTTDYTKIIQNKIKELSSLSNGGTIFLGNGTYNISNFIELYDNIKLIGTGNTVIKQTDKTSHVIIVSGSNITIKDLRLRLYSMTTEEKDSLQYNSELTACIYINSDNGKNSSMYNAKYLDNIYCKNLTVDNVYLLGNYGFKYTDGTPTISNDYEHYRGCGIISERLYFNYATLTNVYISGMYRGLSGCGGSNNITIFCENTKTMAYGGGGYISLNIFGHSYYTTDADGNTISMSDEIGHFTILEQSYVAEYVYDVQWMKNIFVFEGQTMNNRYIVSQIAGASYFSNDQTADTGLKLGAWVIDYGRGNKAIENFQNTPYHIGTKYIDKTTQSSFKVNDPITQSALSGAGVWGDITSNDAFDKGSLLLSEICRYPTNSNVDKHADDHSLLFALSNNTPTEEQPIEIIIDISNRPIYALFGGFIQFDSSYIASDFEMSFDITGNNNFTNAIAVKDNIDTVWYRILHQGRFAKIYKIKIVITKALYIESLKYQNSAYTHYEIEYNPNKKVGICNIGIIDADFAGRTFLGECGGKVYGDLLLNKNSTIKNVPDPADEGDAVSKKYVDRYIGDIYNLNTDTADNLVDAINEVYDGKVDKVENYGLIHIDDYYSGDDFVSGAYDISFVGIDTVAGSETITICTPDCIQEMINPTPITETETTLELNKQYNFGEVEELSLTFPTIVDDGDVIYLTFKSGATPTALTIDTTNTCDIEVIPEANTGYEIFGKYNGEIWIINYSEYTVSEV